MHVIEKEALERLLTVAKSDTGQAGRIANFLLAWWNAEELGGFDFTNLWNVDEEISKDILTVIGLIARNQKYPDSLGYSQDFKEIIQIWRKEFAE